MCSTVERKLQNLMRRNVKTPKFMEKYHIHIEQGPRNFFCKRPHLSVMSHRVTATQLSHVAQLQPQTRCKELAVAVL